MTSQSQRLRKTALPFPYWENGLEFELESYSLDGGKPTELNLDVGQSWIYLDDVGDWDEAHIFGRLMLPETVLESVLPPGEREQPPAKLYVAIRCHDTIYRDRVEVESESAPADTYDVKIPLRREDFRGKVELRPYLVRTEEGDGGGKYASVPNARLASGELYTAVVDREEDGEPPTIDGEEASFSKADYLPDGEKLYYLDLRNPARPKLWINSDHPRIADVLQSRGSVGAEPRMRDVVLDQISYSVWTQLLVKTGTDIDESGETRFDWQQTVVDIFTRDMYGVDDTTEAALRLREDVTDTENLPFLMERIDAELQEYLDPREQLINLMEEGLQI